LKRLHVYLHAEDAGLDFEKSDFEAFDQDFDDVDLIFLEDEAALLQALPTITWIDTWHFDRFWYELAPNLKGVFTPAAGKDWVHEDPRNRVPTYYGTFHGPMIAESMLGMMLHFNRRIPVMMSQQRGKAWNRDAQLGSTLLCNQTALIVGDGNIGRSCGQILTNLGMRVYGHQRNHHDGIDSGTGVQYVHQDDLDAFLPTADHVIILLPGGKNTHHFMSRERLIRMRPTAFIYNFGRGTTIGETDLLWALDEGIISGAGIDVTETEPLPADSRLWDHPGVLLQPHSACIFQEYQQLHIDELTLLFRSIS